MSKIKANILQRVRIVFLCVALFVLWIIAKIFIIQYVDGGLWLAKAEKNHVQFRKIKAERGNIYDQYGRDLAVSIPFFRLAFDPSISKLNPRNQEIFELGIDTLSRNLALFFGDRSAFGYKNKIIKARDAGRRYMRLNSKTINYLDKKIMESWPIFREGGMRGGVIFEKENKRFKPHAELARRTIGDIKTVLDTAGEKYENGIYGLEYSFDKELGGNDGEAMFAKISSKFWKPLNTRRSKDPINGLDVYTTIDIDIQDVAENALLKALESNEADNGCAIVMDVETGQIRAMANLDQITSKNGTFSYRELYNYAVGKRCEPGSTMKLASMMAILEDNSRIDIDKDSVEIGKGIWNFSGTDMRDSHTWNDEKKYSINDVFVTSSNVGIAKLVMQYFGESMGTQSEFTDYLTEFRLSESLGFQLKGAAEPDVMTPQSKRWSGIALPWMAHGYGVEMSPLQMLAFYNAVANDGYYKKPVIVSSIKDDNKLVNDLIGDDRDHKLCSNNTVQKLQKMLLGVVESPKGTARNIRNSKYLIAGKTGTAQKLNRHKEDGRYVYEKKYYSSFCGYFPADIPKYSIIVAIDNAKKGRIYGGDLAAPVFKEIADKIYASEIKMHEYAVLSKEAKDLPRITAGYRADIEYVLDESNVGLSSNSNFEADYVFSRRADDNRVLLRGNSMKAGIVPQVVGMTLKDALPLLENKGLKVRYSGKGRVQSQSKLPGSELLIGSTIKLALLEK